MGSIREVLEYLFNAIKIWIIVQPWEQGLRVRFGKTIKHLTGGIYFKIPYIDSIYIQSVRLRVISLPVQTLTSKDLKTVTLSGAIGYVISDIEKLYKNLYHPELTLSNIAMSELAEFIYNNNMEEANPHAIEMAVSDKINKENYGINIQYFKLNNFAVVKTFRLIQDHSWVSEGIVLDKKVN